MPAFSGDF